ncbi:insulin-like growth factor 2 mRNA-binding protein 1 isoform X2 [Uloborus diversus]|nr:insulin-like growth factor 2 mRNA-binding protein 1 isoform X2 [Uloborus diversus]
MGSQLLVEPSLPQNRRHRGSSAIQISNIPEQYPWDDFSRLLSNFGSVQHSEKGPSKQNTYSAIATYENQDQAQQAHLQLNNYEIQQGVYLKVDNLMDTGRGRGPRGRGGPRPFNGAGMPYRSADFPLRILVLSDMVGAIIGRAGGTIRQITQQSRARVDVHRKENAGSPEKVITIYGTPENCSTACQKIMEIMQQESNTTNRGEIPLKILAHNNLIGRIIGKNGSTIKRIMEQTETKVTVSSNIHDISSFNLERIITIKGKLESIARAEKMVSTKLRQSYENDLAALASQTYMYPGVHPMAMMSTTCSPPGMVPPPGPQRGPYGGPMYHGAPPCMPPMAPFPPAGAFPPSMDVQKETVFVFVPNSSVGAIIGTGGSTIRDMISSSGASIKVIQPNKDDPVEKLNERKVCITGPAEAQWKAQFMIFKKVGFEGYPGPQDATLKVEIFVPTNQVGRIIGKGGQTVRELQRMTHALIKFPEDGQCPETEETAVHIIGDFYRTQAAQRQIRALVYKSNAYQQRRRMSQQSLPNIQN